MGVGWGANSQLTSLQCTQKARNLVLQHRVTSVLTPLPGEGKLCPARGYSLTLCGVRGSSDTCLSCLLAGLVHVACFAPLPCRVWMLCSD